MFVPYAPLASSALTHAAGALAELAAKHNVTPAQLELAWLLHHSSAMTPIPGTSRREHLRENLAALQVGLTPQDMSEIEMATQRGVS